MACATSEHGSSETTSPTRQTTVPAEAETRARSERARREDSASATIEQNSAETAVDNRQAAAATQAEKSASDERRRPEDNPSLSSKHLPVGSSNATSVSVSASSEKSSTDERVRREGSSNNSIDRRRTATPSPSVLVSSTTSNTPPVPPVPADGDTNLGRERREDNPTGHRRSPTTSRASSITVSAEKGESSQRGRREGTSNAARFARSTTARPNTPSSASPAPQRATKPRVRARSAGIETPLRRIRKRRSDDRLTDTSRTVTPQEDDPPEEPPAKKRCHGLEGLRFKKNRPAASIDPPETETPMDISRSPTPTPAPVPAPPLQVDPTRPRDPPLVQSPSTSPSSTVTPGMILRKSLPPIAHLGRNTPISNALASPIVSPVVSLEGNKRIAELESEVKSLREELTVAKMVQNAMEEKAERLKSEVKSLQEELTVTKMSQKAMEEKVARLENRPPQTSILVQTGASSSATVGGETPSVCFP